MERETGFEPATSTLARSHSTTELVPQRQAGIIIGMKPRCFNSQSAATAACRPLGLDLDHLRRVVHRLGDEGGGGLGGHLALLCPHRLASPLA